LSRKRIGNRNQKENQGERLQNSHEQNQLCVQIKEPAYRFCAPTRVGSTQHFRLHNNKLTAYTKS
jgi:hypothetical protein